MFTYDPERPRREHQARYAKYGFSPLRFDSLPDAIFAELDRVGPRGLTRVQITAEGQASIELRSDYYDPAYSRQRVHRALKTLLGKGYVEENDGIYTVKGVKPENGTKAAASVSSPMHRLSKLLLLRVKERKSLRLYGMGYAGMPRTTGDIIANRSGIYMYAKSFDDLLKPALDGIVNDHTDQMFGDVNVLEAYKEMKSVDRALRQGMSQARKKKLMRSDRDGSLFFDLRACDWLHGAPEITKTIMAVCKEAWDSRNEQHKGYGGFEFALKTGEALALANQDVERN